MPYEITFLLNSFYTHSWGHSSLVRQKGVGLLQHPLNMTTLNKLLTSLQRLPRSAPEKNSVARASSCRSTQSPSGVCAMRIRKMSNLAAASGGGTYSNLSKRPGRSNASSNMSGRFVAASTSTPMLICNYRSKKYKLTITPLTYKF